MLTKNDIAAKQQASGVTKFLHLSSSHSKHHQLVEVTNVCASDTTSIFKVHGISAIDNRSLLVGT